MKPYYKALTGVRAVAAFMVYLHHYNPGQVLFNSQVLFDIFNEFHVGVTFFFTLIGFLIATRYLDKSQFTVPYITQYITNRFARIYPLYFIITTGIYGSYLLNDRSPHVFYGYFLNLTFLKGVSWEYLGSGIQQAWSLTVEECFYLFALVFFLGLQGNVRRKTLTWMVAVAVLPLTGFWLVRLCNQFELPFFENYTLLASYTFWGRFAEFFIGIGLALVLKHIRYPSRASLFTYGGILLFGLGIYFLIRIKYMYSVNFGINHPLGVVVNNLYLPLTIALLFAGLLKERTLFSRILSSKTFSVLGKSSYAFYLIHMGHIHALLSPYFVESTAVGALLIFLALVVLAILLYYIIEEPANKKIRALASRTQWPIPIFSSSSSV